MGANEFWSMSRGKSAQDAFRRAVDRARAECGNQGYTGSIAEKSDFVMIDVPKGKDPSQFAMDLLSSGDPRVDDKWGPAGCVRVGPDEYLFFGWASS